MFVHNFESHRSALAACAWSVASDFDNRQGMKKRTLQFGTLKELTVFSKTLSGGFLLNTNNLTLTARISDLQAAVAQEMHNAVLIETNEKVYSYDMIKA